MPNINDKDYEMKIYFSDPCTCETECVPVEKILNFEDFEPIYAPVFVDMFVSNHKTLKNFLNNNLKKYSGYKYEIPLKYPMSVGTIIGSEKLPRRYWLSEYLGRDKKGSYRYRLQSTDVLSVNSMDEQLLKEGVVVYRKGQYKNSNCK